ncbi:MAG: hypothetical protein Q4C13_03320 [Clostridia bacterium]|nr:hypothetical protein [Clostridia bacterium]
MKRFFLTIAVCILPLAMLLSACGSPGEAQNGGAAAGGPAPADTAAPSPTEAPTAGEPVYYGSWSILDSRAAEVSALSAEETAALLGSSLDYQADAVLQNGDRLAISGYVPDGASSACDAIMQDYRVDLEAWRNGAEEASGVSVTAAESFFGDRFFIVNSDTLWIYYEGVFFLAARA